MFIFNLHCQLVLRISGNMLHKNRSQCKIPIIPEEGWFGQPKYSLKTFSQGGEVRIEIEILSQGFGSSPPPPPPNQRP